ncbi:regulatory protein RecX [Salmonella enterica subsp. enterica serovar Choleraesuis]|nr:regulatory protein RecX [Salmonella enterica subsp. enterica serovar Choleraesuis]
MTDSMSPQKKLQRLKDRAARLLAMRDHSEQELRNKLLRTDNRDPGQEVSASQVEEVINWCHEHNWLNDEHFASRYIQSRARKGYGPQRISQELMQKGIPREMVNAALAASDLDWTSLAREQAFRKAGADLPVEFADKIKLQRFLLYRGYYMEDIQDLYRNFPE